MCGARERDKEREKERNHHVYIVDLKCGTEEEACQSVCVHVCMEREKDERKVVMPAMHLTIIFLCYQDDSFHYSVSF